MPPPKSVSIVAGIAVGAFVGALAYTQWRKRTDPPAESHFEQTQLPRPQAAGSDVALSGRKAPSLPPAGFDGSAGSPIPRLPDGKPIALAFLDETRDEAWAKDTEAQIATKLVGAPAQLTTECRSEHCQITVGGDMGAISKTIAMMEDKSLRGYAREILLGKPESRADGTMSLRVFASFDR